MEARYHRKNDGVPQEKERSKREEKTIQDKNEAKVFKVRPRWSLLQDYESDFLKFSCCISCVFNNDCQYRFRDSFYI